MTTLYQKFKPCPAIQPFADCYWLHCAEAGGNDESPVQRCVPFGTLKIILQLDAPNCQFLSGTPN